MWRKFQAKFLWAFAGFNVGVLILRPTAANLLVLIPITSLIFGEALLFTIEEATKNE